MGEMKLIEVELITGKTKMFRGIHMPELEKPNWHYWKKEDGNLIHFRKENMVSVEEID